MKIVPEKIDSVLVIGLSCIGDMLLASCALWNLRLHLPKAHFTVWVGPRALAAVEEDPMWDEVSLYDRKKDFSGFFGRLKAVRKVRKGRFDLIIDLRSGAMPLFSGARYRPLWGIRELRLPKTIHEAERNLYAVMTLGVPVRTRQLRFYIPEKERVWVAENVAPKIGDKRFALLNPGAAWPREKRWPVERFGEFGKRLLEDNLLLGVIGYTEAEQEAAQRICRFIGEKAMPLHGKTGLGRLAALLEEADLFVTNDTGPLHLASAVGTPTVGIYGPTRPERYGPWGNRHRVVFPDLPCAPCGDIRRCPRDPEKCLSFLPVGKVLEASRELLGL